MFLAVLLGSLLTGAVVVLPQTGSATGLLDLRIYVGAAGSLRDGRSIYEFTETAYGLGSTYPPVWSLLVLPFTALDIHLVELGWTMGNAALWFAALWIAATPLARPIGDAFGHPDDDRGTDGSDHAGAPVDRRSPRNPWLVVLIWALSIVGAPMWNTLNQGQLNIVIWLLLVIDVRRFLEQDRRAGILVGVAAALKLHPAIAALLILLTGAWRSTLRAAVAFVATTAVAAIVLWDDSWRYWTERIFDTSHIGSVADAQNNSIQAVLARTAPDGTWRTAAWVALDLVVLALGIHGFRLAARRRCLVSALVVVGLTTALLLPISWTHHLVFLSLPLLLVAASRLSLRAKLVTIAVVSVVLLDPVGFGRLALTSDVRVAVMLVLLVLAPLLVRFEDREGAAQGGRSGGGASPPSSEVTPGAGSARPLS